MYEREVGFSTKLPQYLQSHVLHELLRHVNFGFQEDRKLEKLKIKDKLPKKIRSEFRENFPPVFDIFRTLFPQMLKLLFVQGSYIEIFFKLLETTNCEVLSQNSKF